MNNTERWPGRIALMVAHCAGMIDLVALPVWVGTLIAQYQLDPQQAGGLATLFLTGVVVSSVFVAPRLHRLRGRVVTTLGFGGAALAFLAIPFTSGFFGMAILHALAGLANGCGLSVTHGTIGRSARPHRLFAIVGTALGVFAIIFLGATPKLVAALGGPALFWVFGAVMLLAAVVCGVAFPGVARESQNHQGVSSNDPIDVSVWFGIIAISCMSLVQAMTFSFVERIGVESGFGLNAVTGVLIALGIVNLFPAPMAALLEHRWSARKVVMVGPVVQAGIALLITHSATFIPYAGGTMFFAAVMIFIHTFAFGLLSQLDPSGRAVAATPAMLMAGSAIGPLLGGTLVKFYGYGSLGLAAIVIGMSATFCFSRARRRYKGTAAFVAE